MHRINRALVMVFFLVMSLFIMGCQQKEDITVQQEEESTIPEVPYSKGPSAPPSVVGPTTPPPGTEDAVIDDEQPQAVTEVEEVRYSLPTTSTPEFKQ